MINKLYSKRITLLVLIVWVLQASVAFSSGLLMNDAEMPMVEHVDHGSVKNSVTAKVTSCHANGDLSCEKKHCAGCFYTLTKEQGDLSIVVAITQTEEPLFNSPIYITYNFDHPPQ